MALSFALPALPVHVTVTRNAPVCVGVYVRVPDVAVEPKGREPLQLVVPRDDQLSVAVPPNVIDVASNDALTVGRTGTLAVAASLPPGPVHVTVTLNSPAVSGM